MSLQEVLDQEQNSEELTFIDDIFNHVFKRQESTVLITFGRRQSGKTDFNLLIAEMLHDLELVEEFATNIKIYDSPFEIKKITCLPELEDWGKSNARRKLFILDEAGRAFKRRTPMSKINVEMIDKLQIVRKYKMSILQIATAEKFVDSAGLDPSVLDGYIVKPYFNNPTVAMYTDLLEDWQKKLVEIPSTRIKFDTWDTAPFTLNRTIEKGSFQNKDMEIAYEWLHGANAKQLGLHRMQLTRTLRKVLSTFFEKQGHK